MDKIDPITLILLMFLKTSWLWGIGFIVAGLGLWVEVTSQRNKQEG